MDIGSWIYNLFGNEGEIGLLLCIFLIFLLDALVIPTLPELFFIIGFMGGAKYREPMVFGCELLLMAILAEIIGIYALYYVVKHVRVPKKIESVANKYTNFLIMSDERLLLLNRVAPMLPFAGAFIALSNWNVKKSFSFIVLGCVIKYGILMLLSNVFYNYFSSEVAGQVSLVMVFVVIGLSAFVSFFMKKKKGLDS